MPALRTWRQQSSLFWLDGRLTLPWDYFPLARYSPSILTLANSGGERNVLITTLAVLCPPHRGTIQAGHRNTEYENYCNYAIGALAIHLAARAG